jgi:hypothetical protein
MIVATSQSAKMSEVRAMRPRGKRHSSSLLLLYHSPTLYIQIQLEELQQPTMDVLKAVQVYINKMITEVSGMKVLLLDAHTVCDTAR